MITLLLTLSIIFNSVADGVRIRAFTYKENKLLGYLYHFFFALTILSLLFLVLTPVLLSNTALILLKNNTFYFISVLLIGYSLVRFGIFDFIVNIVSGKHPLYIGNTSLFDIILKKIFKTPTSLMFYLLIKGICLIAGLYILQRILNL